MRLFFDLEATLVEKDPDVTINKLMDNNYHVNMKANENMVRMIEILSDQHEIFILTPKLTEEISLTKELWLRENAPFIDESNILYYEPGKKHSIIPSFDKHTDILFDDYLPVLEKWSDKEAISFFVGEDNEWENTLNPNGLPGVAAIKINRAVQPLQKVSEREAIKHNNILVQEPIKFQSLLKDKVCEEKTVILNFIAANETFENGTPAAIADAFPKLKSTLIKWQYVLNQQNSNIGGVNTCKVADNLYVSTVISKDNFKVDYDSFVLEEALEKLSKNNVLKNATVYAPVEKNTPTENIATIKKIILKSGKEGLVFAAFNQYEHKDKIDELDLSLYNDKQIEQLRDADRQGLDVNKLMNPEWDHYKMRHIKIGLANHVDLTPYADQYTSYQLKQIRNCLLQKISVEHFTPEMESSEMNKYFVAEMLAKNADSEVIKKFVDPTYESKKLQASSNRKKLIASIKEYPILSYAEEHGFDVYRIGRFYGIREYESVRIKPWENTFVRYSQASQTEKGHKGSIIDFVMEVENLSQAEAIEKLTPYASVEFQNQAVSYQKYAALIDFDYHPEPVEEIELPPQKMTKDKQPDNRKIIDYLTVKREINTDVVEKMIKDGMLYQDTFYNCVFVMKDENGKPIFASRRGTNDEKPFKQDLPGCDYNNGFYIDNGSDTLIVTEGVIEIMSLVSFSTPDDRFRNKNYLSLNSVYKLHAIFNQLEQHPEIKNIKLALNNDDKGLAATDAIKKKLKDLKWEGKVDDIPPPTVNDYNDLLVNQRKPKRELIAGTRLDQILEFKNGYFYQKKDGRKVTTESVVKARDKLGLQKNTVKIVEKNKSKQQQQSKDKERRL